MKVLCVIIDIACLNLACTNSNMSDFKASMQRRIQDFWKGVQMYKGGLALLILYHFS